MNANNSVAPAGVEPGAEQARPAFSIPDELLARYEIRVVEASDGAERRVGMFLPRDRTSPALEIGNERIVARNEDAETVASLVKLAQHNGWGRIDVEGSAGFRKAVWSAAVREGLTVSGYAPTFAEQERMEGLRRDGAPRQSSAARDDADGVTIPSQAAQQGLSDGDRRLLLTLSRHTEDRKALYTNLDESLDAFQREVQYERIDLNRQALGGALERALESGTLQKAFRQSGYEPDLLREMGKRGEWDGEVADAIYLVRSGLDRSALAREPNYGATPPGPRDAEREGRSAAGSILPSDRDREAEAGTVQQERRRDEAGKRDHESEELAEFFLHGAADEVAADPRLANAIRAQGAMEQHIAEVFQGDAGQTATANLESRQMISDVLRRGLDVSVREPTPVRQIEPVHSLEMER